MQVMGIGTRSHKASIGGRRSGVVVFFASLVLAAGASALTLGEFQLGSTLGEPVLGLIQVDAAASETIRRECFSPGTSVAAVPGVPVVEDVRFVLERRAGISYLRVQSRTPVREPLAQVVLQVRCPGLPTISRAFVLLLDPASMFTPSATLRSPGIAITQARTVSSVAGDIAPGSNYTVQNGDTLSGVASRIAGRPSYSVWPLAARIKAINPQAFENGRADRLIAGARLQIPTLDGIVGQRRPAAALPAAGATAAGTLVDAGRPTDSRRTVTDAQRPRSVPVLSDTPVILAGPVPGTELEYLVITSSLSELSLERIRQRTAETAPVAVEPSMPAPVVPAIQQPEPAAWYAGLWRWLLLALALVVVLAGSVRLWRRRSAAEPEPEQETPWELDDAPDDPLDIEPGRVYDDSSGSFVSLASPQPDAATADPEDDIQTHLMPALGLEQVKDASQQDFEDERDFSVVHERTGAHSPSDEKQSAAAPSRDDAVDIDVSKLDETGPNIGDDGWVELDFESTQILEQDYLAEYAAKLKERIQEQNAAQDDAEPAEDDEDEPLLAATDLMAALGGDGEETTELSLADDDATRELPVSEAAPESDDDTLSLSPEDNVVAIDQGKKAADSDSESGGQQPKGRKKS